MTEAPAMMHRGIIDDLTSEMGGVWSTIKGNFGDTIDSNAKTTSLTAAVPSAISSSSSSSGSVAGGAPLQTAAVGIGALIGGVAILANI